MMVSIGKAEVGKDLCKHLGIENGKEFIFADPDNILYDDLELNKGIKTTFFSPATPFAFKDRIFREGSLFSEELSEVLGKWKDAVYIPPKTEQAFNQGASFIFDGETTLYAHYDEATAAHAMPDEMVSLAIAAAKNS